MRRGSESDIQMSMSHNNYDENLLGNNEEKLDATTQKAKKRAHVVIPAQNVIRICVLSTVLGIGYALNTISVLSSMDNMMTFTTGVNGVELWAFFYVFSNLALCVLCGIMILITFCGSKMKDIAFNQPYVSYLFLVSACVQILSLFIGLFSEDNHGYIYWEFELLYSLLPFYVIFLIYFFKKASTKIKVLRLSVFSFILFITPMLRATEVLDYVPVCVSFIVIFILIVLHMYCFLNHYDSGLLLKLIVISLLIYSLHIIIFIYGSHDLTNKYSDNYRIYYYYVLLTVLYAMYSCEMFASVPPKINKISVQHLQDRESWNTEIEKYDGTLLSMSKTINSHIKYQKLSNANGYTFESVFDMAHHKDSIGHDRALFHSNPNERIESVIKIFPDFKPCEANKDKYFSEFNVGDLNNEKDRERLVDSIAVIVPFYNESAHEIYATLRSLYFNFDYLKKTQTKYRFTHFNVLLVGDGWFKADISTKRYLSKIYQCNFNNSFGEYNTNQSAHNTVILQTKGNQKLCINPFHNSDTKLFLKVTAVIKIDNRKKANSHEWFLGKYGFAEWCQCDFMYFTDAYSTLNVKGLYQMLMHMKEGKNKDVVCCTGKARIYSHTQEVSFKKYLRSDISHESKEEKHSGNEVCGMYHQTNFSNTYKWWQHSIFKMEEDIESNDSDHFAHYNSAMEVIQENAEGQSSLERLFSVSAHLRSCQMFEFEALYGTIGCYLLGGFLPVVPGPCGFYRSEYVLRDKVRGWYFDKINSQNDMTKVNLVAGNMKLAEDRILTITSILNCTESVRHSLIPECVFYFDPQPSLTQLMKQRRRWINGSIATVIFVLKNVAFTEWKVSWIRKKYVLFLWYIQLAMFAVLFISPPLIFVLSFHYGLATILYRITSMSDPQISALVVMLQIISWLIYLLFIYFAQKTDDKSKKYNMKSTSVKLMLAISYTFGLLTLVGSIMQAIDLANIVINKGPKWIFKGEYNEFNFFVMTFEFVFLVQTFVLAPLFTKDWKTLYLLLTHFLTYFMYSPFYVIFFFINAIANVHDLSWGTRPDTESEKNASNTNPKRTTFKILLFLLFFNVLLALTLIPLSHLYWPRMIFFVTLSLPSILVIIFSLVWLFKANTMDLLRQCKPKRIDDQFRYVYKKDKNQNKTAQNKGVLTYDINNHNNAGPTCPIESQSTTMISMYV